MADYLTFQEFIDADDAAEMAAKLKQRGIDAVVEKNRDLLGQEFIGKQYNSYILLKIPGDKFKEAQQALISDMSIDMNSVDRNYMLFSLSNDELTDVIAKPDEWGAYNYNLAQQILKERQININDQQITTLQQEHLANISRQRSLDTVWLVLGYFFSTIGIVARLVSPVTLWAVYGISLMPGILGIIMGFVVMRTKRILPDGSRIMSYNAKTRKHGAIMATIGVFAIVFNILLTVIHSV